MKTQSTNTLGKLLVALTLIGCTTEQKAFAQEYVANHFKNSSIYYSGAYAINNHGDMAGSIYGTNFIFSAALYSDGVIHNLGTMGGVVSYAYGINDSRQVVGIFVTSDRNTNAFLYTAGSIQGIEGAGLNQIVACKINNNQQVIGWGMTQNNYTHAFLWQGGVMHDIGNLCPGHSWAMGINNSGQVVGYMTTTNGYRAFLYTNNQVLDLGTLNGGSSIANAINDKGQIACTDISNLSFTPAVYENNSMRALNSLGYPGYAYGINNLGQVVGYIFGGGQIIGALFTGGTMKILASVSTPMYALVNFAYGINDNGQIVADQSDISTGLPYLAYRFDPLAQGWKEAITNGATHPAYGTYEGRQQGKNNLILITHGWIRSDEDPLEATAWVGSMSNSISAYLVAHSLTDWQVSGYKWIDGAHVSLPDDPTGLAKNNALSNAKSEGEKLGKAIAGENWSHVHLIAHSAGAGLIQAVTDAIESSPNNTTSVHETFLDAFVGLNNQERGSYGIGADWADSYFTRDKESFSPYQFTEGPLDHCLNIDVTRLDPNKVPIELYGASYLFNTQPCYRTETSHGWPIDFYSNTITGSVSQEYQSYGFPLSEEGTAWNLAQALNSDRGNEPIPLGSADPSCFVQTAPTYVAPTIPDFLSSPSVQSDTGMIQKWIDSLHLFPGSPAWISTAVNVTNPINVVSFDSEFVSTNGSASQLSVYWDSNVIGFVDESVVEPGLQHYTFAYPTASAGLSHMLGFRLDPSTNAPSSVIVTNVELFLSGPSHQSVLSLTTNVVDGLKVLQLNGDAGFNYRILATSDLVNWTNIALLINTNGTVQFVDRSSTNCNYRFYRAVAAY